MQLLTLVLASAVLLAAEPAKSRPMGLDVDAIVEQAKQLDPPQKQAWLRRLEWRLKRATTLVLKPADAEKKLAEYQELFGHNPPDWQQIAKLVQQTDVAEKAAIGQLTRQYRVALYESLFGQRKEYELRHDALKRVLKAWEASGQPFSRQEVLVSWLQEAVRCNTRGSIAPLPPDPDFTKDPPLELPPEPATEKQPTDGDHGQQPEPPVPQPQSTQMPTSQPQSPKSPLPQGQPPQTPLSKPQPGIPPAAGEDQPKSLPLEKGQPDAPPEKQSKRPAEAPRQPDVPATSPQSAGEATSADAAAVESSAMRLVLERLGAVPLLTAEREPVQLPDKPDWRPDTAGRLGGSTQLPPPAEPWRRSSTDFGPMPAPPEPPIWTTPSPMPPVPPSSAPGNRPSEAAAGGTQLPGVAAPRDGADAAAEGKSLPELASPPGWPDQLAQPAARMAIPAPLPETDSIAAPLPETDSSAALQLAEPSIQTAYHGSDELRLVPQLHRVSVEHAVDESSSLPPPMPMLTRRRGSTNDTPVLPDVGQSRTDMARHPHDPPLNLLAARPIPLEELPKAQVNLAELNARIEGYNYSLRALEAELHGAGPWDSARIRPALQRLKRLAAQRRDLEVFRSLLPAEQRNLAAQFEPIRPVVAQIAERIAQARQAAQQQGQSVTSAKGRTDQATAAELEQLDALSRELAEFGQQ